MKYFTTEELLGSHREHAHSILEKCEGQIVRFNFGIDAYKKSQEELFPGRKDLKTLDLGAAGGIFASQLSEQGYNNLYGLDVDNYLNEENKKFFKEFKTADLSLDKIPWPDKSFKVVTAWCVLPHLENPFHCVREIARVLDDGGVFIFTAPHLTSKPAIDYFTRNHYFGSYKPHNNHLVLFTPNIVKKTISKHFELLDTSYAVRPKIFTRDGLKGKLRKAVYDFSKNRPKLRKKLGHRWAYDAIYTARKKS